MALILLGLNHLHCSIRSIIINADYLLNRNVDVLFLRKNEKQFTLCRSDVYGRLHVDAYTHVTID